MDRLTLR